MMELPYFQHSKTIACYFAASDELDTQPFMKSIWETGKLCYLPVITPEKTLMFVRYDRDDQLIKNQYDIFEPADKSRSMSPALLDMIAMPLVAFDRLGQRLGTGGGYYDKTLAGLNKTKGETPYLVGMGFSVQEYSQLPADNWDVRLDAIVTEKEVIFSNT